MIHSNFNPEDEIYEPADDRFDERSDEAYESQFDNFEED